MPVQLASERERKWRGQWGGRCIVAVLSSNIKTPPFVLLAPEGRIRKQTVTIIKGTVKKETKIQFPQAANLFLKILLVTWGSHFLQPSSPVKIRSPPSFALFL